jgi:hypothetical protein
MRRMTMVILLLLLMAAEPFASAQRASDKGLAFLKPAAMATEFTLQDERTIEDSELTPVAAQPCGTRESLKSLNGDTRTFLRFKNKTNKSITYYWINYEGKREQERVLKAGEIYSLWTYLTHPFVVVNAKGECRAVYLPRKEYGLVVITEAPK